MQSLKKARLLAGFETREQVAQATGLKVDRLRRYENGQRKPSPDVLGTLADAYGVTLDQLAGRVPLPEPKAHAV